MKKTLAIIAAILMSFSLVALAQQPQPTAKKPTLLERLFGKKKTAASPQPKTATGTPIGTPAASPNQKTNSFQRLFGASDAKQPHSIDQVISSNTQPSAAPATNKPAKPTKKKPSFFDKLFSKKKTPAQPAPKPLPFRPVPVTVTPAPQPAQRPVITGKILCAGKVVTITPQNDSYILTVPMGKKKSRTYTMRRVPTTTGAVRLQNSSGKAYWLQLGNKSMLLDTSAGGRMADNCRNADQQRVQNELDSGNNQLF